MTTISLEVNDLDVTVVLTTPQGISTCTIDAEGARDFASALQLAASILDKKNKKPELRVVD